jgi:hypothetical protein
MEAIGKRPSVQTLALDSPGGSVVEALALAREIADRQLATSVPERAVCFSACAYVFFAGRSRVASGDLGVHQVAGVGISVADTQFVLSEVIDALTDFDVPPGVISVMLRTKPDKMHIFTEAEKATFGLNRGGLKWIAGPGGSAARAGLTPLHRPPEKSGPPAPPAERIVAVEQATSIASMLWKGGITASTLEQVLPLFARRYSATVLPPGSEVRIRFGAGSIAGLVVPLHISLYVPGYSAGLLRHIATAVPTGDGSFVLGDEPSGLEAGRSQPG